MFPDFLTFYSNKTLCKNGNKKSKFRKNDYNIVCVCECVCMYMHLNAYHIVRVRHQIKKGWMVVSYRRTKWEWAMM